jgi:hypothetical protein
MAVRTVTRYCTICEIEREIASPLLDGMEQAPGELARALDAIASAPPEGWSPRGRSAIGSIIEPTTTCSACGRSRASDVARYL